MDKYSRCIKFIEIGRVMDHQQQQHMNFKFYIALYKI
jgi:hypothetical protein